MTFNIQLLTSVLMPKTIFFQKSLIFSGKSQLWPVFFSKSVVNNPFQVLWTAKRNNQRQLFSRYYQPCHRKLTLYCMGMLKDIELAENAASDTLLKLYQQGSEIDLDNPERWLFTVAKNKCLSLLSQKKRRREIEDQLKPTMNKTAPAKGDQRLEVEDLKNKIRSILNTKEWAIWNLHQQGYDNKEMAQQLQMTEKTVANLKSIARNKLRKKLTKK